MKIVRVLALVETVRERLEDLKILRGRVPSFPKEEETRRAYTTATVDKEIVHLRRFLANAVVAIGESNARTDIEVAGDVNDLIEALSPG